MFRNIKIGMRLAMGFALIFILLISLTLAGINRMNMLSDQTVLLYNHPLAVSNAVLRINTTIIKIHREMKDVALAEGHNDIEASVRIVDELEKSVYKDFEVIEERFLGDKEKFEAARNVFTEWKPIRDEVIGLMFIGQRDVAADITRGKGARHVQAIEHTMEALGDFAGNKAAEFLKNAHLTRANALALMYALMVVAVVFGVVFVVFLTRSITLPIARLRDETVAIGKGEGGLKVLNGAKDEVGELATSFNKMAKDLRASRDAMLHELAERKRAEAMLKESEERQIMAQEVGNIGTWDWNPVTGELIWSDEIYKILGFSPDEVTPSYELFLGQLHAEDREMLNGAVQEALHNKAPYGLDCRILRPDGMERTAHAQGEVQFDDDGKPVRMLGVFRDVTEKRQAEEELQRAQRLESLGVLAGGIAHDFNNLLLGILGNLSLMKHSADLKDSLQGNIVEAEKATFYAKDLAQQLLTFSKGGAPVKEVVSIFDLIEESVGFALRGSNVKSDFIIVPDLMNVEVDMAQISQVINNLIINAKQAMPEGGTIRVVARNVVVTSKDKLPLEPGDFVCITVEDGGPGIPDEVLSRLFDPYFTTKDSGSGLGLATAYSIIRQHKGHIAVVSKMGVGTEFSVYIPATTKVLVKPIGEGETMKAGTGRVLVMDDEEIIRDVTQAYLDELGYEFTGARDGLEAIRLYKEAMVAGNGFVVVIMDLTIKGGVGGKDAIAKILEIDPRARAIVSSGYSDDPVMANYKEYGFMGCVAKPYTMPRLSEVLDKVLKPGA